MKSKGLYVLYGYEWYVCDEYILSECAGPVDVDGAGVGLQTLAGLARFGGRAAKACPFPFA